MAGHDDGTLGDQARAARDTVESTRVVLLGLLVVAAFAGFVMAVSQGGDNGAVTMLGWLLIVASVIAFALVHALYRGLATALEVLADLSDRNDSATP